MSTKNIYCKNIDITKLKQNRNIEGKDIRFLGIGANVKDAADRAMESCNGNLLIDVVVYTESAFIVGGYKVKGTVVEVPYKTEIK